jgi:hypothetical protein
MPIRNTGQEWRSEPPATAANVTATGTTTDTDTDTEE